MEEPKPEEAPGDAPAEAPASDAAAEETKPPAAALPSKSNLVDKRASSISKVQSRVRLVEPGQEGPAAAETEQKEVPVERKKSEPERRKSETERRGSEAERRKSDAERRRSDATKLSKEISSISASHGGKGAQRPSIQSREGVLRRRSDRPSKAKATVGSTISIRRTSGYGGTLGGATATKFMNTYKLDSDNPFHVEHVEKILRDVLTEALDNLTYDPDKCPKQAKWASSAIRARVKEQDYDRYKFVIIVTIGEKRYQDMCSVARFLWDIERDKYALFVHENMHVYAAAMCFGLYYE